MAKLNDPLLKLIETFWTNLPNGIDNEGIFNNFY